MLAINIRPQIAPVVKKSHNPRPEISHSAHEAQYLWRSSAARACRREMGTIETSIRIHTQRDTMPLLTDQTAIITGAGQGLGRAIALEYAAEGASVALLDVNANAVETMR